MSGRVGCVSVRERRHKGHLNHVGDTYREVSVGDNSTNDRNSEFTRGPPILCFEQKR